MGHSTRAKRFLPNVMIRRSGLNLTYKKKLLVNKISTYGRNMVRSEFEFFILKLPLFLSPFHTHTRPWAILGSSHAAVRALSFLQEMGVGTGAKIDI